MQEINHSTSVFWSIAGLAMLVGSFCWPFLVAALATTAALRSKSRSSFFAFGGACLALLGHIVRVSGVAVKSSAANIPLPLLTENYLVYFLFFHAIPIGMALFSAAFLYAFLKHRM